MLTNYLTKNLLLEYNFSKMRSLTGIKTIIMNLKLISAYFHSVHEHKSGEGFNSTNSVLRQVDAFVGLWSRPNLENEVMIGYF